MHHVCVCVCHTSRNLTGVEERESGTISFDVVKRYVNGGGGLPVVITLVILYTLEQVRAHTHTHTHTQTQTTHAP